MLEIYLKLKFKVYNMKKQILIILLFLLTIFVSGCYMKVEEDFFINELTKLTFTVGDEIKINDIQYDLESNVLIVCKQSW